MNDFWGIVVAVLLSIATWKLIDIHEELQLANKLRVHVLDTVIEDLTGEECAVEGDE